MKFSGSIPIVLTLMLTTIGGRSLVAQPQAIAQVTEVKGRVELKREGENYRPAKPGEPLYRSDQLRVQKGATGVIRCNSDSSTWTVPDDGIPRSVAITCAPPS